MKLAVFMALVAPLVVAQKDDDMDMKDGDKGMDSDDDDMMKKENKDDWKDWDKEYLKECEYQISVFQDDMCQMSMEENGAMFKVRDECMPFDAVRDIWGIDVEEMTQKAKDMASSG